MIRPICQAHAIVAGHIILLKEATEIREYCSHEGMYCIWSTTMFMYVVCVKITAHEFQDPRNSRRTLLRASHCLCQLALGEMPDYGEVYQGCLSSLGAHIPDHPLPSSALWSRSDALLLTGPL